MSNSLTPWTVALQAPLSMEFPKQEHWSGLPHPPPGDLPDPGIEHTSLMSPALACRFFTISLRPSREVRGSMTWDPPHPLALSGAEGIRCTPLKSRQVPGSASASLKVSLVTKAGALGTTASSSHRPSWDLLRAGQQHHQSHLVSCSRRWNLGGIDSVY